MISRSEDNLLGHGDQSPDCSQVKELVLDTETKMKFKIFYEIQFALQNLSCRFNY
jgi:hypothetical protein